MAQVKEQRKSSTVDELVAPDERFWKRYSPHHEAVVSGVGSLTLHGLLVGVMIVAAWIAMWSRTDEKHQPPTMAAVELSGDNGNGLFGGGEAAPLGRPDGDGRKEAAPQEPQEAKALPASATELKDVPEFALPDALPEEAPQAAKDDVGAILDKIGVEAKQADKAAVKKVFVAKVRAINGPRGRPDGLSGGKGDGGKGSKGPGTGIGPGNGPGTGLFGPRKTKQQIYAQRWRFDPSGSGKQHAEKLAAAGVVVAVREPTGQFSVVRDLRRRPAKLVKEDLSAFKDAVKWFNVKPESLYLLATELQLPFIPSAVALLLPKEREEKMADAEAEFARRVGRPMNLITETWFDFQLHNGSFEPIVIRQK